MGDEGQDGSVDDDDEDGSQADRVPVAHAATLGGDHAALCEHFVELLYLHHVAYQSKDWVELIDNRAKFRLMPPPRPQHRLSAHSDVGETSRLLRLTTPGLGSLGAKLLDTDQEGYLTDWVKKLEQAVNENRQVSDSVWQQVKNEHLSLLREIWSDEHIAEMVHVIMGNISPQISLKFLHALCVRLPPRDIGKRKWYQDEKKPVKLVFAEWEDREELEQVASSAPKKPNKLLPTYWFHERFMREVAIFYTEVNHIFGRHHAAGDGKLCLGYVNFTQALTKFSDKYDDHFATPIGQAITSQNWDLAFPQFVWQRSMDLCFQMLLSWFLAPISQGAPVDKDENENAKALWVWPRQWHLVAITWFGLRGFAHISIELIACLKFLRNPKRDSIPASYFNPYTLFCLGVEVFSAWYVAFLMYQHWTPPPIKEETLTQSDWMNALCPIRGRLSEDPKMVPSVLYNHPGLLAVLIFVKWVQLMLSVMNFNVLLPKLLPAWTAITSVESLVFLLYLVILSCGTMLSYYSLPSDLGPGLGGYFTALYRMFRLDFFADFDDDELEGISLAMDRPNKSSDELVEEDRANEKMHLSMKGFTMLYSLVFPVIIINMYIGVLSDIYQKCLAHNTHVCGLYMSQVTCRLLLYRHFYHYLVRKLCPWCTWLSLDSWRQLLNCFGWFGDDKGGNANGVGEDAKGVFIVLPVDFLPKEELNDGLIEKFKGMEKTLRGLQHDMRDLQSQLAHSRGVEESQPRPAQPRRMATYLSLDEE